MHGIRGGLALTEQVCWRIATAAIAEGEAATAALAESIVGIFAMCGGNHEAILVIGNCQIAIHVLGLRRGQPGLLEHSQIFHAVHVLGTPPCAHRHQAFQCANDRAFIASGEQVGQIPHGDTQRADIWQFAIHAHAATFGGGLDRRQRRHVPHHRQGAVFRMQRQRQFPINGELVGR